MFTIDLKTAKVKFFSYLYNIVFHSIVQYSFTSCSRFSRFHRFRVVESTLELFTRVQRPTSSYVDRSLFSEFVIKKRSLLKTNLFLVGELTTCFFQSENCVMSDVTKNSSHSARRKSRTNMNYNKTCT